MIEITTASDVYLNFNEENILQKEVLKINKTEYKNNIQENNIEIHSLNDMIDERDVNIIFDIEEIIDLYDTIDINSIQNQNDSTYIILKKDYIEKPYNIFWSIPIINPKKDLDLLSYVDKYYNLNIKNVILFEKLFLVDRVKIKHNIIDLTNKKYEVTHFNIT